MVVMLTVGAEPAGPAVESGMRGGERSYRANGSGSPLKSGLRHWLLRVLARLADTVPERSHPLCTTLR